MGNKAFYLPKIKDFIETKEAPIYKRMFKLELEEINPQDFNTVTKALTKEKTQQVKQNFSQIKAAFDRLLVSCLKRRSGEVIRYLSYLSKNSELGRNLIISFDCRAVEGYPISYLTLSSYLELLNLGYPHSVKELLVKLSYHRYDQFLFSLMRTYFTDPDLLTHQLYCQNYDSLIFTLNEFSRLEPFRKTARLVWQRKIKKIDLYDEIIQYFLPDGCYLNGQYHQLTFLEHCSRWQSRGIKVFDRLLEDCLISLDEI